MAELALLLTQGQVVDFVLCLFMDGNTSQLAGAICKRVDVMERGGKREKNK